LYAAWEADRQRYEKRMQQRIEEKKRRARQENVIAHPALYDELFGIAFGQLQGVGA
jgi:hypothetical protein